MLNIGIVQNQVAASYIFDVKTDNAGTSNNDQFTLPLDSAGTYNFVIDWGDGSAKETITTWNQAETTHTFSGGAGTYTINIWGTIILWYFASGGDKDKIVDISRWGTLQVGTTQGRYFQDCTNLTISSTDVIKTNLVSDMNLMFSGCTSLVDIPNIRFWDTSGVTDMTGVFRDCDLFNADLSEWDVGNVTDFTNFCIRARDFTSDLSAWDTSSMTRSVNMFNNANDFDSDCSAWDVSSLTDATNMFSDSNLSNDNYNLLLEGWSAQSLQSSVPFHGGNSEWYFGYGGQSKYDIISGYSWTITDNGQNDSSLGLWLNAHNLLKTSANPSGGTLRNNWLDLSDNANNASATSGQRPRFNTGVLNGEPGVLFDGANDRLNISPDASINDIFDSGGSVFVVLNATTEGEDIGRVFSKYSNDGDTNGCVLYLNDDSAGFASAILQQGFSTTNGIWSVTDAVEYGSPTIILITYDNSSTSNDPVFYVNSKTPSTVTEGTTPVGSFKSDTAMDLTIGNSEGTNRTFDGYIFELGVWKKVLSTSEISDYFDYFSNKYGVTLT